MARRARAALLFFAVSTAGCLAPPFHSVRMAEPGQVVLTGTLQGVDVGTADGTGPATLVELGGTAAVGITHQFQLEANGAVDPTVSWLAGAGARFAYDLGPFDQLQFAAGYQHASAYTYGFFPSNNGEVGWRHWDGGDVEVGFVHHLAAQWVSPGVFLGSTIADVRDDASNAWLDANIHLSGILEIAPPQWKRFKFLAGLKLGVPLVTQRDATLGYLQAGIGGLVAF